MCDTDFVGAEKPEYTLHREREFYKYYQPLSLGLDGGPGSANNAPSKRPRASPDRALTAFAQLACLRLDCRRAYISFFDREFQYIVAEATRTLSLQEDSVCDAGDELLHGAVIAPKKGGLCEYTVALPIHIDQFDKDDSVFIVPNCQDDDRFKDKLYTTEGGNRFYAGVPIVSPTGYRIGSYCVVDDKPRDGLKPHEVAFMKDMATTVMVHMDMVRAKVESVRGEKMVRGLGSFVEGKNSIEDWHFGMGTRTRQPNKGTKANQGASPGSDPTTPDTPADSSLFWADEQYTMHHERIAPKSTADEKTKKTSQHAGLGMQLYFEEHGRQDSVDSSAEDVKPVNEDAKNKQTGPTNTLSIEVKETFARAANIMREALSIDGVCCFDAKAHQTFGGLVDQEEHARPQQRDADSSSSSESERSETAVITSNKLVNDLTKYGEPKGDNPCEVLGFSTYEHSSIHGDQSTTVTDGMTEGFLRSLLRRYPHGKILNFDANGESLSARSSPSGDPLDYPTKAQRVRSRKKERLHPSEVAFIRKIFPHVRSLAIVPLWDNRQQFFSACVAWTRNPHHILSAHSELSYIAAFGDSIMAEVARIDTRIKDKSKSDFISSISHELRSPLHGILGSVECLQDSTLDAFQENMVHTVETCGKTLLDTIDHLLDFAKINNFTRKGSKSGAGSLSNGLALDTDVDLSVITEEVLETVFAGHDFIKSTNNRLEAENSLDPQSSGSYAQHAQHLRDTVAERVPGSDKVPVAIIVDINKADESHWIFRTQAGAWRRILMNLFGNSLKYTQEGFIQVKLEAVPLPKKGKTGKSTVTMTVLDSGKGISDDYLNQSLFVPFAQEDTLQPGTGLGLAITAAIVRGMGGTIDVKSEQGHGTEITVKLEMTHAPRSQESLEQSMITSAAKKTKGLKIGFVGFDADPLKPKPSSTVRSGLNARHLFMTSFFRQCQNWFGMDMQIVHGLDNADADILLTTEKGIGQVQDELAKTAETKDHKKAQELVAKTPLLVMCNSATTANAMLHHQRASESAQIVEYISQPCGPRKLAKSITLCLEKAEAAKHPGSSPPSVNKALNDTHQEGISQSPDHALQLVKDRQVGQASSSGKDSPNTTQDPPMRPSPRISTKIPSGGASEVTKSDKSSGKAPQGGGHNIASPLSHKSSGPASAGGGVSSTSEPKHIRNVLLVDDNKINLQLLVTYMKKSGHHFTTATNGLEAWDAYKQAISDSPPSSSSNENQLPFRSNSTTSKDAQPKQRSPTLSRDSSSTSTKADPPSTNKNEKDPTTSSDPDPRTPAPFDFILMDLSMPVMDGLESARHIRATEKKCRVKPAVIIALTGLASASAQQEAFSSGIDTFMTKPVKLRDLSKILERGNVERGGDGRGI